MAKMIIANDAIYEMIEYEDKNGVTVAAGEKLVMTKDAFIEAYKMWIEPNITTNDWERRLP